MALTTDEVQAVEFDNVPQELKEIDSWVLWAAVEKGNGFTKVPLTKNGEYASSTNSSTWITFKEAQAAYENGIGSGIGIVLNREHDLYVLDIDGTTDHEYYERFKHATYCETSPSGNGIHVYMLGDKPKKHKKDGINDKSLELFSDVRFITVTGHICSEVEHVAELNSHIDHLIKNEFAPDEDSLSVNLAEPLKIDTPQHNLSQHEVIQAMSKSRFKDDIAALMQGDISQYDYDHSRADWALISHLAYWTARNEKMMWDIFTESGLYDTGRGKRRTTAQYDTYVQETIRKAVLTKQKVYEPQSAGDYSIKINELPQGDKLKKALTERRFKELAALEKTWEEQGKNGRKPSTISTIRCAVVLQDYVKFILFDLEENTKLSMYMADEGIYTQNTTLIQRVISWLEPRHNKSKADEVIYHIKNMAEVKEKTNSRYLIPVNNGVFNLQTKKLEKFTPDYVFTTKVHTNYYENPVLPEIDGWNVEKWIEEIACYDIETVRLLWQVINDSLNGNYTRKKAIFLVGTGNNGKGTYQELLTNLIGFKNIATLKANEFEERFRISVLEGKTAVIGDDVPPKVYIDDSSTLKSVITGDNVSVEQKGQPIYNTSFKCTVIQSTNDMPKFRDKTAGVLRRFIIVPFRANFEVQTENFDIKEDYIKRAEVLEYVLHKAINMDFETFDIPKVSLEALDEFKQDNDPVYEFKTGVFDEWNIPEVPKNLVYAYYRQFCEDNGYNALSVRKFHNEFKAHLSENWQNDTQAKFTENKLQKYVSLSELKDRNKIDWQYPDPRKPYKTYKNDLVQIV